MALPKFARERVRMRARASEGEREREGRVRVRESKVLEERGVLKAGGGGLGES